MMVKEILLLYTGYFTVPNNELKFYIRAFRNIPPSFSPQTMLIIFLTQHRPQRLHNIEFRGRGYQKINAGCKENRTRRLAACTQAFITLRSTSYIAIDLKCSAFEVMGNSIESMCLSYSAFDWISWNRLIV